MIPTKLITTGLSLIACAGVAITSWLSVKGSKKAQEAATTEEKIKAYAPAIASGVVTGACILTGQALNQRSIAGLAASAAYVTANRDKIKQKLVEEVGEEKAQKMIASADQKAIAPWEGPSIEWTGNGTQLFLEGYSGRLFYSSCEAVAQAQEKFNERYHDAEELSFNDYYRLLSIMETGFGDMHYWDSTVQGDEYIQFVNHESLTESGEKMIILDILTDPMDWCTYEYNRRCGGNHLCPNLWN